MTDDRDGRSSDGTASPWRYVSSNYQRLYPAGIGLDAVDRPLTGDLARDPAAFGIEWVARIFPAAWYGRGLSPSAIVNGTAEAASLSAFYAGMANRMAPAAGLVRIDHAIVHDSLIWAERDGRTLVYETYRHNDRPAVPLPRSERLTGAVPLRQRTNTDYLMLGSAGSSNYGHFLVDDLPRLAALRHLPDGRRRVVLMTRLSPAIDTVRRQAVLAVLGQGVDVEWLERDTPHAVRGLFYPTPVSDHPWVKSPAALAEAAALGGRLSDIGQAGEYRLFVTREETGKRDIVNRGLIEHALGRRGFRTVLPERLTFVEQVRLFSSASIVVGQMGAALTNMMFAPPGGHVLCLAPSGWIEPFYWDLAELCGHRYSVLFGPAIGEQPPIHQRCFSIDAEMVERWCDMTINSVQAMAVHSGDDVI